METVLMSHPETVMPFCVTEYVLCNDRNETLHYQTGNHQTRNVIRFVQPVETTRLSIHVKATHGNVPAALFEVRCYA
jgi:hypothetical protein